MSRYHQTVSTTVSADYLSVVSQKSFARLTDEALDVLCALGPIVDVGAGNGWWDRELAQRGVDVTAVEPNRCRNEVFPRIRADHWEVVNHPDRALLMIWPTKDATWPAQCVALYQGPTVAYIGDPAYRVTANPMLRQALKDGGFTLERRVRVGSWPHMGFTDMLMVWQRPRRPCWL